MPDTQFESVLNLFNISIEEISMMSDIEESHFYRLLNRSVEPDSYTLEKLSNIFCVSENEILSFLKLNKKNFDNVIIYPVFTSFHNPFYIFKLCAFEDDCGISLNKYLSFISKDFNVEYRLLNGQITIYDSQGVNFYKDDSIISVPLTFDEEEYIADMTISSVLMITISSRK